MSQTVAGAALPLLAVKTRYSRAFDLKIAIVAFMTDIVHAVVIQGEVTLNQLPKVKAPGRRWPGARTKESSDTAQESPTL
jgi:hypothetical protein